jgi:hypothetical protein
MEQFSSTDAKQGFGRLLKAAAQGPVAIEKHGKVQAIVAAPEFFAAQDPRQAQLDQRRLARLGQELVEKDRLIRHQRIAVDLLTSPPKVRQRLIREAQATVERWRVEALSSRDYIDRWTDILRMPVPRMAEAMTSDADGWGPALRQNSPWVGVHA